MALGIVGRRHVDVDWCAFDHVSAIPDYRIARLAQPPAGNPMIGF
jgi:hypothetical protein